MPRSSPTAARLFKRRATWAIMERMHTGRCASPPVRSPARLRFSFPENFLKLVTYPKNKGDSVKGSSGGPSFFDHLELEFLVSRPVLAA